MENLCFDCEVQGWCCYSSTEIEGYNITLSNYPCEDLDIETRLCKRYDTRECGTVGEQLESHNLPKECEYVKRYGNPHGDWKLLSIPVSISKIGLMKYLIINNMPEDKKDKYIEQKIWQRK